MADPTKRTVIAKAAEIGNPKRIFVIRKQESAVRPQLLIKLLNRLLDVEASLKPENSPDVEFTNGLLSKHMHKKRKIAQIPIENKYI